MNSEGLGEMFEGDSADMCAGKFPLMSMGGRAEGLLCADPGARTPVGMSGNCISANSRTKIKLHSFNYSACSDYLGRERGRQASAPGLVREVGGTTSRPSAPGLARGLAGSSKHSALGLARDLARGHLLILGLVREAGRKRCSRILIMSGEV